MARISQETRENINKTQKAALESLSYTKFSEGGSRWGGLSHTPDETLNVIRQLDETAVARLGDAGKTLTNFVRLANLDHPEMNWLSGNDWGKLSQEVRNAISSENKAATDRINADFKPLIRQFASIKPRLIQEVDKRNELRNQKKSAHHVSMKQTYLAGENAFYGKPENFQSFIRFNDGNKKEIEALMSQKEIFASHKMNEVSHAVDKRIKSIQELHNDEYLGFQRIKPADAAIVLARLHGLKWSDNTFITIPMKYFDGETFWTTEDLEKNEESRRAEEVKKQFIFRDKKTTVLDHFNFQYQPRLYPLSSMNDVPERVQQAVNTTENLPELKGGAAFDYYWVLCPSINIGHQVFSSKGSYRICRNGMQFFKDEYEAASFLDHVLIKEQFFSPILLGEREGLCYFVCMWE